MGEAHSEAVRETCAEYGVLRQTTAGYTPEHNAFIERWFRTNAEMSRCQMQQFSWDIGGMSGVGHGMARWITRLTPLDPECVRAEPISVL